MNVADSDIVAAKKKLKCQFHSGSMHSINYRPICFGKIGAQGQHVVQLGLYSITRTVRDLSRPTPADEKAHSGSMLAGRIVSRKIGILCRSFCFHLQKIKISLSWLKDAISYVNWIDVGCLPAIVLLIEIWSCCVNVIRDGVFFMFHFFPGSGFSKLT